MIPTVMIHDSDGEVFAPIGKAGIMIRGKRRRILVTEVGKDATVPLAVREALKDMEVSVIFTSDAFKSGTVPAGSRFAYVQEIIENLERCGKTEAAPALKEAAPGQLDLYGFEPEIFELLD